MLSLELAQGPIQYATWGASLQAGMWSGLLYLEIEEIISELYIYGQATCIWHKT